MGDGGVPMSQHDQCDGCEARAKSGRTIASMIRAAEDKGRSDVARERERIVNLLRDKAEMVRLGSPQGAQALEEAAALIEASGQRP